MARYKNTDTNNGQGLFLTVNLNNQLLPGTFEYMLNNLIGNEIDISIFDNNYSNDKTGTTAIPPSVLIKLIIYSYSKGIKSSRAIEELSKNNITAKALAKDIEPHWTTIANFISSNGEIFKEIFIKALTYCGELGLIGGETFAIDGCRLPSNASLQLSGTKEELRKRVNVYRRMAEKHITKHRKQDKNGDNDQNMERNFQRQQKHLNRQIEKISDFLENMEKKEGKRGGEIRSNVTDNESAMIMSSSGYIQGYIGLAVSDSKNQIILSAQAVGSANECEHLPDMLDSTINNINEAGIETTTTALLADKNYFSEENLRACEDRGIEAIIPDSQYKKRLGFKKRYEADDFKYYSEGNYYECPQGKQLEYKGICTLGNGKGKAYHANVKDCRICPDFEKCIRSKKVKEKISRGRVILINESNEQGSLCSRMRERLNMEEYQERYVHRIQIIEPVFANITYCKGLKRFSLRGREKVNGQWLLYCMVHNLGKCLNGYNKEKMYA